MLRQKRRRVVALQRLQTRCCAALQPPSAPFGVEIDESRLITVMLSIKVNGLIQKMRQIRDITLAAETEKEFTNSRLACDVIPAPPFVHM